MGLLDNAKAFVTGGGISVGRGCVELFFLASDLSSSINGETIVADGGQTRTQGNLNALMQKLEPLFAANPELVARNLRNLAAITPDELMGK